MRRAVVVLSLLRFVACDKQDTAGVAAPHADPGAVARAQPVIVGPCQKLPSGVEDLTAILEPMRRSRDLPALAAAIVTPEGLKAMGVTGVRRYGDPTPACVDDAFQLGSDTKAMSAVVIAHVVEQGRLSWSTTIGEVFSDVTTRNRAYDSVTLDLLMAHRAGFAHNPTSMSLDELKRLPGGTLHEQREAYARVVLREPPKSTPGTEYAYSNTGYTLAGLMAERRTGQSWEDLLRLTVFEPLGLTGAGFGPSSTVSHVDGPWPHTMDGVPTPLVPDLNAMNPLYRTPAGNVKMPIASWARFVQDMLLSFEGKGVLLRPASYQRIHTPTFAGNYSFGWLVVSKAWTGGTAYNHAGTDMRNYASAWVAPRRRVAFLVATNVGKSKQAVREVSRALRQRVPGCEGGDDDVPPSEP